MFVLNFRPFGVFLGPKYEFLVIFCPFFDLIITSIVGICAIWYTHLHSICRNFCLKNFCVLDDTSLESYFKGLKHRIKI